MFGNINAGANLPSADADGDGLNNFLEYALNSNPVIGNGYTPAMSRITIGGEPWLELTFTRNPAATNVTLTPEASSTLTPGSWNSDGILIEENTATALRFRLLTTTPRRFSRVRVTAN